MCIFFTITACSNYVEKVGMKILNETAFISDDEGIKTNGIPLTKSVLYKTKSGQYTISFSGIINIKESSKKRGQLSDTPACVLFLPLCLLEAFSDPYIPTAYDCHVSTQLNAKTSYRYIVKIINEVDQKPILKIFEDSRQNSSIVNEKMSCILRNL